MKTLLLMISLLLFPSVGSSFDVVRVPTANLHVTWLEPTLNSDGTPLTDLEKIVLILKVDGVARGEEEVPASGLNGGQEGFHTFMNVCEPGTMADVEIDVRAVDTSGNWSTGTIGVLTVDCVAPGPVQ